jgi:hypothetical protein
MDAAGTKRVTEALKRLGDDDRAFVLAWLLRYYEDDGRMRSPRGRRRSITLDEVPHFLVRMTQKSQTAG